VKPFSIAPRARLDLRQIGAFIVRDNPERALSFVDEIEAHARRAAERPLGYRLRDEIGPGLRGLLHGRYSILFRDLADEVRVVRILHTARDFGKLS